MPQKSIIKAVLKGISTTNLKPPAKAIDLSCGDGEVITAIAESGFNVEATHYRDNDYIFKSPAKALKAITVHKNIDLAQRLMFDDGVYDMVVATEVLEHLPNHNLIIAEISRILKPGGFLIFTTPNIQRISSRLQYFLTGTHNQCGARLGWHIPRQEIYSTHYNPVHFSIIHTILHQHKLHITGLQKTAYSIFLPVYLAFWPLTAAMTCLEALHAWKRSPAGARDLLRWLLDIRMQASEQICIIARKNKF